MRHNLSKHLSQEAGPALIPQKTAIRIMRVRNCKPRYKAAFDEAGLKPEVTTGKTILYRRSEVVEARKRLDEIEKRKMKDSQGTLHLETPEAPPPKEFPKKPAAPAANGKTTLGTILMESLGIHAKDVDQVTMRNQDGGILVEIKIA